MRIPVIEDNRDILANVLDYLELKGYWWTVRRTG